MRQRKQQAEAEAATATRPVADGWAAWWTPLWTGQRSWSLARKAPAEDSYYYYYYYYERSSHVGPEARGPRRGFNRKWQPQLQ